MENSTVKRGWKGGKKISRNAVSVSTRRCQSREWGRLRRFLFFSLLGTQHAVIVRTKWEQIYLSETSHQGSFRGKNLVFALLSQLSSPKHVETYFSSLPRHFRTTFVQFEEKIWRKNKISLPVASFPFSTYTNLSKNINMSPPTNLPLLMQRSVILFHCWDIRQSCH